MWQRPIIVLILLATQAAAGTATSFQLSISGRGRALAQDGSVVGNPFANSSTFEDVATCQSLQDVLEITNRTHNSTHEPTQQEVQECVDNSHLSIADGRQLLFAIREDRPLVKVMQSSGPIIALPSRIPPSIGEFFKNDSVAVLDCQGNWIDVHLARSIESLLAVQDNSTSFRDDPGLFPDLDPTFGTMEWHMRNHSDWCWTEEEREEAFPSNSQADSEKMEIRWWIIGAGALSLVSGVLVTIWLCLGRPCCICRPQQDRTAQHMKHPPSHAMQLTSAHPSDRSTEELAEAMSAVLKTHRVRTGSSNNHPETVGSINTSSHASRNHEPACSLRECPDCGHPHPDPPAHRQRHKSSLRAHTLSDTHSFSDRASGSAGLRQGPGRESAMDSVSVDDRYSGTSISLAPPRVYRSTGDTVDSIEELPSRKSWDSNIANLDLHNNNTRMHGVRSRPVSSPPSEHRSFHDAQNNSSVPTGFSGNSSPKNTPFSSGVMHDPLQVRSRQGPASLQGMFDSSTGDARIAWLPPQDGFNSPSKGSPTGSPRHFRAFSDSGTVHPLLQQYNSPPATHPILHRVSQELPDV